VWQAARTASSGVRNDNLPRVRFSATVDEEPEIVVELAKQLGARGVLTELRAR
jgi:hypothetical protein